MQSKIQFDIIHPTEEYSKDLARFNTEMAFETEGKKLVDETINSGCLNLIKQPKYGSYFTAIKAEDKKAIGSLLTTYEYNIALNKPIHWIQSVYVESEYRGCGIFRSLYDKTIEEARKNNSYSVKLYVETTNEKAKGVYSKLGMSNNNQEINEVDFGFGEDKTAAINLVPSDNFKGSKLAESDLEELSKIKTKHLLGTVNADELNVEGLRATLQRELANETVVIREGDKIVGVVSAFPEWSDWRDKVMQWVYDVKISADVDAGKYGQYLQVFLKLAFNEMGGSETMGAYRINFKDSTSELKKAMIDMGLEQSHYYVYEIVL